jgi:hypothetical protein
LFLVPVGGSFMARDISDAIKNVSSRFILSRR